MPKNPQLELASEFVQFTDRNIFLTGKAGTGKTTFLHQLRKTCPKRMVVVAPTGVAAINARGSTIHSFFQLPFGVIIPETDSKSKSNVTRKMGRDKINLIKSLDLLVIDEISMVRADTLDGIDEVLRRYRDRTKPFGGVQLLLIGDLHQLSPVIKDEDWRILKAHYDNLYFFNSKALIKTHPISIELKHIYRQSDTFFIEILNAVRENNISPETLDKLNQRYIPGFDPDEQDGYITLTSHNQSANRINEEKLKSLIGKTYQYRAEVSGDFPGYSYPNAEELIFKQGAQVMFVKNDSSRDKLYFNGKIGKIVKIKDDFIHVKCKDDYQEIVVSKVIWENFKFELNPNTKEIEENVIGTFSQFPLKLAWAITIHKSQGLTFEKAIIDANLAFAHGQVYVALSRCKTFEGMVLSSKINYNSVKTDGTVSTYTKNAEENAPDEKHLKNSKIIFQQNLLFDLFDFNGIKSALFQVKKLAEEYYSIISVGFLENTNTVRESAEKEVYAVAEKFKRQMNLQLHENELPENNSELQIRIKKGCVYFMEKLLFLEDELSKVNFDADNKAVKKSINDGLENLNKAIAIKKSGLRLCSKGFETLEYLKTKANAEIDFENLKKTETIKEIAKAPSEVKNVELYHQIKNWRDNLAAENNLPVYQILPQKVLVDLVNKLPSNFEELESIKGIGKVKVKQFGNELLTMISNFCENAEVSKTPFQTLIQTKKEKVDTKRLSLDFFKAGKSVAEIAQIRGFTTSTIESHLIHYIPTGEVSVFDFMEEAKVHQIKNYILDEKPSSLNVTKGALGDHVSYGEIKAVIQYLQLNNLD